MFIRPPREPEWMSWLFVGLWAAFIYLSIPYVRVIVRYVAGTTGREIFIYLVVLIGLGAAVLGARALRKRTEASLGGYLWLAVLAAIFVAYTIHLSPIPEEAVHFVEYGVLSLLLYRAFSHRVRDKGIYLLAGLVGALFGMLDEAIQWAVPNRQWDMKDIWLNVFAVFLIQLAIWQGIRPPIIVDAPSGRRLRQACRLAAAAVLFFGLSFVNTPAAMTWYGENIEALSYFRDHRGTMVEYGYLIEDPEVGIFRSRLTTEELRRQDENRATEGAAILDRYRDRESYSDFLGIYTPAKDPFLHEARVHLFRRDRYLERAAEQEDADKRRDYMTVAFWENRILESYFPNVLSQSSYLWPPELRAEVEHEARRDEVYVSAVSKRLMTDISKGQAVWFFAIVIVGLLLTGEICNRVTNRRRETEVSN